MFRCGEGKGEWRGRVVREGTIEWERRESEEERGGTYVVW